MKHFKEKADKIQEVANLLRGDYKRSDFGKVILPMTVLRRLDSLLAPTKHQVLAHIPQVSSLGLREQERALNALSAYHFHNRSSYDFDKLLTEPENLGPNFKEYLQGFSSNAREIMSHFHFEAEIDRMDDPKADILFLVLKAFRDLDLQGMDAMEMGYVFEDLIKRFAEQSNETAGEHFTPRGVIRLMVQLLFSEDQQVLSQDQFVKTLYDPACGTGGMLSMGEHYLKELNPRANLQLFGQELNPESYAICQADLLIRGQNPEHIKLGNSFSDDGWAGETFDYMLSNPPFGVDWKKVQKTIQAEHEGLGMQGRFGLGLPRVNDGSLLFLQHMLSKMKPSGTRMAIVFNASPLCSGVAGSGESNIRRWIIEQDYLEAIIALPDQLFYNTAIKTYIWILSNAKREVRKGKIQLIDARGGKETGNGNRFWQKLERSLGKKRREITEEGAACIAKLYKDFEENAFSKIYPNAYFAYWRVVLEDSSRVRTYENIPFLCVEEETGRLLKNDMEAYFASEIKPYRPQARLLASALKVGYEINFPKLFYQRQEYGELNTWLQIFAEKNPYLLQDLQELKNWVENPRPYDTTRALKNHIVSEIPAHWEFKKLKYGLDFTTGFTPPTQNRAYYGGDITWVTIADMQGRTVCDSETKIRAQAIRDFKPKLTQKGSLLFSFKLSVGKVALAGKACYTNEAIMSIPPREGLDLRYFYYSLPEQLLYNAHENIYGAKILNQETIRNAYLTFPPYEEQVRIADFLDRQSQAIEAAYTSAELIFGKVDRASGALHAFWNALVHAVVGGEMRV